jgi:hypothetical protein
VQLDILQKSKHFRTTSRMPAHCPDKNMPAHMLSFSFKQYIVLNVVPQEVLVPNVVPDGFFDIGPASFLLLRQVSWHFSALCLASS